MELRSYKTCAVQLSTHRGFTLVEVMVVVAIVGILLAVALPGYRQYVERGDRASARAALLEAQQFMERFYVANDSYSTDKGGNAVALPSRYANVPVESPRYSLAVAAVASTPNQYTLTATPLQTVSKCGNLTLEHTGAKGISSPASATSAQIAECWK